MAQIQLGKIYVASGSTKVCAVYALQLTGIANSQNFTAGAEVQYGAGGADEGRAYVLNLDGSTLNVYRKLTTDQSPAESETIRLVSDATTTATISALASTSPPNWSTRLSGISGSKLFTASARGDAVYQISASSADTLTLSTAWAGASAGPLGYSITTDFTPNVSLPILARGSIDPSKMVTVGFTEIDRRLHYRGSLLALSGDQSISANTWTVLVFGASQYDQGGFVATSGDGFFTVPANVERVRVTASATSATADGALTIRLVKNGAEVAGGGRGVKDYATTNNTFKGALIQANATQALGNNTWDTITVYDTSIYDEGGFVASAGDSFFTVPTGVSRVRLSGSVELTTTAGANYAEEAARIVKDISGTPTEFPGSTSSVTLRGETVDTNPAHVISALTAAVPVSAGDKFLIQAQKEGMSAANRTVANSVRSWFAIESVTESTSSAAPARIVSAPIEVAAGDTLKIEAYHTGTGPAVTDTDALTWVSIESLELTNSNT